MWSAKGPRYNQPYQNKPRRKRNWDEQCEFCKMKGHGAANCYQLIGYPDDSKGKRKPVVNNTYYGGPGPQQPPFYGAQLLSSTIQSG